MLNIPDSIKDLYKTDSIRKNFRVHFPNGEMNDITNEQIVTESVKFTESIMSQNTFRFGLAEAPQIEFETVGVGNMMGMTIECYHEIDTTSLTAAQITAIQAMENLDGALVLVADSDIGYGYYQIPLGVFTVSECPRNHNEMTHRRVVAISKIASATFAEASPGLREFVTSKWTSKKPVRIPARSVIYDANPDGLPGDWTDISDRVQPPYSNSGISYYALTRIDGILGDQVEIRYIYIWVSRTQVTSTAHNANIWENAQCKLTGVQSRLSQIDILCDALADTELYTEESLEALKRFIKKERFAIVYRCYDAPRKQHSTSRASTTYDIQHESRVLDGYDSTGEVYTYYRNTAEYATPVNKDVSYKAFAYAEYEQNDASSATDMVDSCGGVLVYIPTGYRYNGDTVTFDTDDLKLYTRSLKLADDEGENPDEVITDDEIMLSIPREQEDTFSRTKVQNGAHTGITQKEYFSDKGKTLAEDLRNILDGWCEINAQFAKSARDGTIRAIMLNQASPYGVSPSDYSELWWDEYDVDEIGTILFNYIAEVNTMQGTYTFGNGGSVYDMRGNTFIQYLEGNHLDKITALLDSLFIPNIAGVNFTPIDLSIRGLPYLEAGDYIGVEAEDGTIVNSYILQRNLDGIQLLRDSVESTNGELLTSEEADDT